MNERLCLRRVGDLQGFCIPLDGLSTSVRNGSQQDGLGQRTGVIEIAGGGPAIFDCLDPFGVMANRLWNGRFGSLKVLKLFLRQQHMPAIIRQEHPVLTHKKLTTIPVKRFPLLVLQCG